MPVVPVPLDVAVTVEVAVPVVAAADVLPPKSPISLVKAAFKLDSVVDDKLEGVPAAAEVVLTIWPLLKVWMRAVSSATMPCRPYCETPVPMPGFVVTGVVTGGVVGTGVVAVVGVVATVAGAVAPAVVVAGVVATGVVAAGVVATGVVAGVFEGACASSSDS